MNMSEQEASSSGTREKRYLEDVPIFDDDLIDVDVFDFDDDERWLCDGSELGTKSNIKDLPGWLRFEPENEYTPPTIAYSKSIDSRTYTRAKRRSNRTSFDAIGSSSEGDLSLPQFRSRLDTNEMDHLISSTPVSQNFRLGKFTEKNEDYVPAMLRPSFSSPISMFPKEEVRAQTTGPESHERMEAFLNLTQSKGVDSFINMTQPEFTQDIMNVSQASVLSSSITSFSSRDNGNGTSFGMADSQILTSSMMQTSMFDETKDINSFLSPFDSHDQNTTVRPKSPLEETLIGNATFQIVSADEFHNPELQATWTQTCDATFTTNEKPPEKKSLNDTYSKIDEDDIEDTACSILEEEDKMEVDEPDLEIELQEPVEIEEKHDWDSKEEIFDLSKMKQNLLEESRRHSESGKCDMTFDLNQRKENDAENHQSNKFQTFSIKNYNVWKKEVEHEVEERSLDSTFRKPTMLPPRGLPRRLPENLSRLSQGLQKSNPNLISGSLNAVNAATENPSRLKNPRGSQPNIAVAAAGAKKQLKPLGDLGNNLSRMRSGSEQRLLLQVARHVSDPRLSGGSTESIESTQSAHSAPDLDDRVSVCSDSSRGSYTIANNKIDAQQLRRIACMQEESLRGDVSRMKSTLNSTRAKENDNGRAPPTLRNGVIQRQQFGDRGRAAAAPSSSILHRNNDYRVGASLSVTNDVIRDDQRSPTRKIDDNARASLAKSSVSAQTKSKLRPPATVSSNATGPKPSSGIPRPTLSRIPGPKTIRPKTAPAGSKKDYF